MKIRVSPSRTREMGFCGGGKIKRVELEIEGQVYNLNYLGYLVSNDDNDISIKLQR
jgi:hypothetical protein